MRSIQKQTNHYMKNAFIQKLNKHKSIHSLVWIKEINNKSKIAGETTLIVRGIKYIMVLMKNLITTKIIMFN